MEAAQLARAVAPIHTGTTLVRVSGGSETDVYRTDGGHYVLKVKPLAATNEADAIAEIHAMQQAAKSFAAYLGTGHSIPTGFLLSQDDTGRYYVIGIQEYLANARPLAIAYQSLPLQQRTEVEWQLLLLLRQALRCYHDTGHMPDLYGTFSSNSSERRRMNTPWMWPQRIWTFFTQRLWRAYNLLLTDDLAPRVVLVDYDKVRWRGLWGQLYYAVCYLLFWRELIWLAGRRSR